MKKWPILPLAIWLIATGIILLLQMTFSGQIIIMAGLQIASGIILFVSGNKVKVFFHMGCLLLAIWLMISGFSQLLNTGCPGNCLAHSILGIVAAFFLLVHDKKLTRQPGAILVAGWLFLNGLYTLLNFRFAGMEIIMGILPVLAGIFLLIHKK